MKQISKYVSPLTVLASLMILFFGIGDTVSRAEDTAGKYQSMFSDVKARKVGDILTVEIIEFSTAQSQARTQTDNQHQSSLANQATGALDFLPLFNLDASVHNQYDGQGTTTRQGNLRAKITATVVGIDDAGNLIIEGNRTVNINGERQLTTLRGTVRPQDVTADNIVYSYNISNAQITYSGKGLVQDAQKPGIFTRILNWIF
jgi:flagellar L-ring protein precursor FlgH